MGALASPHVIGRYTIYGKIASGGMASVHFGRLRGGEGFARTVAIKRLHPHLAEDPEFRATLIDEARMAARIHHPNVVPTLDVVSESGELLVVMEYVRGESLSRLWKSESAKGGQVPLPIVSAVAAGALHGLHAAHEARSDRGVPLGIVHRDVSPQNVLVGADGVARIIDFGVAKAAGRLQTTREGTVKGKVAYMAPEQVTSGKVTRQADVYAMGVVLWELLTGKRLFQADNEVALLTQVLVGVKEPPSRYARNLPAGLDALVMRALATDAAERFATSQEMAETLVRLVPSALSTEVGRWVEASAGDALAGRSERLGEIESASAVFSLRPFRVSAAQSGSEAPDDVTVLASDPSSLSVETQRPSVLPRWPSRRVMRAGAIGVSLVVAGLCTKVMRAGAMAPTAPSYAAATMATPPETAATTGSTVALAPPSEPRVLASAMSAAPSAPEPSPPGSAAAWHGRSPSSPFRNSARPSPSALGSLATPRSAFVQPRPRPSAPAPTPACTVVMEYDSAGQPHFKNVCR